MGTMRKRRQEGMSTFMWATPDNAHLCASGMRNAVLAQASCRSIRQESAQRLRQLLLLQMLRPCGRPASISVSSRNDARALTHA